MALTDYQRRLCACRMMDYLVGSVGLENLPSAVRLDEIKDEWATIIKETETLWDSKCFEHAKALELAAIYRREADHWEAVVRGRELQKTEEGAET